MTRAPARNLAQGCSTTLRGKQAELKIQAADLSTQFGPSYPKLTQLNNQLKEIDSQIQAEMKKIAGKVRGQYTTALQRENMLHDAFEKQKQEANKLNESAIKYNMLKRDADTYRTLYEGILQKLKEAGVAAGLKSNNFRIVDSATPPGGPIEPNIPRNLDVRRRPRSRIRHWTGLLARRVGQHRAHHRTGSNDFRPGLPWHDSPRLQVGS